MNSSPWLQSCPFRQDLAGPLPVDAILFSSDLLKETTDDIAQEVRSLRDEAIPIGVIDQLGGGLFRCGNERAPGEAY